MSRISLLPFAMALLSGCSSLHVMSHVPVSTISRLSTLKLADIQPAQLRIAARMPEHIEPRKDGVKVMIAVGPTKMELTLEPATEAMELSALSRFQRPGMRLSSYRLSQADNGRLERMIASASDGQKTHVSISAGVDACRRGSLGSEPLLTSTFLRTDAAGFLILTEDLDLRSVVSAGDLAARIPPCL